MARYSVNIEGLTFSEWLCAAGLAVYSDSEPEGVKPFSSSYRQWKSKALRRWAEYRPIDLDPRQCPRHLLEPFYVRTEYYSRKVRKAWRSGEDPTEWRATGIPVVPGRRQH